MSRGISQQQRQILGLAVAVSRFRNRDPIAYAGEMQERWRVPVVAGFTWEIHRHVFDGPQSGIWPHVWTSLAAHILGGVELRRPPAYRGCEPLVTGTTVLLDNSSAAMVRRVSTSRAIMGLLARGLLVYRPHCRFEPWMGSGEVLIAAGLTIGMDHEIEVPDLHLRLGILRRYLPVNLPDVDWKQFPDVLPPPAVVARP